MRNYHEYNFLSVYAFFSKKSQQDVWNYMVGFSIFCLLTFCSTKSRNLIITMSSMNCIEEYEPMIFIYAIFKLNSPDKAFSSYSRDLA